MKAADAIGKRIKAIRQRRLLGSTSGPGLWEVLAIELDDGTVLYPQAVETEDSPCVVINVRKVSE